MAMKARVPLLDLLACIGDTVDLVSPEMANHHTRVAYIAHCLAGELGWEPARRNDLFTAAMLHDIGSFSRHERSELLAFEASSHGHGELGHRLLRQFPPFARVAETVRFHHVEWKRGAGREHDGEPVSEDTHLLHLADRAAVLIESREPPLWQARNVRAKLKGRDDLFMPGHLDAFAALGCRDYFWIDAASPGLSRLLRRRVPLGRLDLDVDSLLEFARVLRRMIDFRSRFTATHSSGVAAASAVLARLAGFTEEDSRVMEIAGHLHDLGKLAVPQEILQKPGPLEQYEYDVMRSHAYHTWRILEPVVDLETIRTWGALHQEYLDGSGYPFGFRDDALPVGARVMAVADVFTALTENRPYRAGLAYKETMAIMAKLAHARKLDGRLVDILESAFDGVNEARAAAQEASIDDYEAFIRNVARAVDD